MMKIYKNASEVGIEGHGLEYHVKLACSFPAKELNVPTTVHVHVKNVKVHVGWRSIIFQCSEQLYTSDTVFYESDISVTLIDFNVIYTAGVFAFVAFAAIFFSCDNM